MYFVGARLLIPHAIILDSGSESLTRICTTRPYNTARPHSALGYRTPAPEAFIPTDRRPTMH
nr:transposase [Alloyangia pacifica]